MSVGLLHKRGLRPRILLSYWFFKGKNLDEIFANHLTKYQLEVFADSGAFSAFTQGVQIDIADYAIWVKRWKHLFSIYANLDVIGNPKETYKNQHILEDSYGLKPLPVFHSNEDWEWLEKYLKRYDYIALGGLGSKDIGPIMLMPWAVKAFKMGLDTGVRYHGFAITTWSMLKALPWYSVDSSTWINGMKYGKVRIFDIRSGEFRELHIGNIKSCYSARNVLKILGFSWKEFADPMLYDSGNICAVSLISNMLMEVWLAKLHKKTFDVDGTRIFLVDGSLSSTSEGYIGSALRIVTNKGLTQSEQYSMCS